MIQYLQNAAAATGNGNQLDCTSLKSKLSLQVAGTFVGTVTFEASNDGSNWEVIQVSPADGSAGTTTATAAGLFLLDARVKLIRARVSAYTSGAISVIASAQGR